MILITGANGFIGSHVLQKIGDVGIDLNYDIRDIQRLRLFFARNKVDVIVHLAALTGVALGEKNPKEYFETNAIGTANLIQVAKEYGVQHFLYASTSSVYLNGVVSEKDIPAPHSMYGISKYAGEQIVASSGLPYTIMRFFTVYGEYGRQDMVIMRFLNHLYYGTPFTMYGDGNTYRGYTYVGDIVEAIRRIIEMKITGVFNIGGYEKTTLADLLALLEKLTKRTRGESFIRKPMEDWDKEGALAITKKLDEAIGYTPQTKLRDGLKKVIKWYEQGRK